jgi:hypothetical protein
MALRYFLRYFDVIDIEHRLDIYDDDFVGDALQVDGNVTLTYSETDNPLEAIRGQGLRVELEANTELTFNNLWSDDEKTFRVEYKRDNVTLFNGWLNPEGFFESYVNTNWIVTFDCIDGLGYLKDLSFIEDATGLLITGRKTYLELISLALIRTGLQLKINTNIDIYYTGLSNSVDILANVYANSERYVKDDGETIMSCDEVLRDILEPFGAVLTSLNGEWYIYKPNQLFLNSTATFYTYTYLGVPFGTPTIELDLSQVIGSDWKGSAVHHCNENQTLRNVSSIGAYRINYKYGLAQSLLINNMLFSSDGIVMDGWDVIDNTNMTLPAAGESGVDFFVASQPLDIINLRSVAVNIVAGVVLDTIIKFNDPTFISTGKIFTYQVVVSDIGIDLPGAVNHYLTADGNWLIDPTVAIDFIFNQGNNTIILKSSATPINGFIYLQIKNPIMQAGTTTIKLTEARLSITESSSAGNKKGEFNTVQRTTKPSSNIEDVKTVATGDNVADIYEGTLYTNDQSTPTEAWNRKGITEEKPILQIMGEETLRMSPLPSRVFSGDTYGFFNYLSVIDIEGLNLQFMPIKYSYDSKKNIITAEFRQIYGNELNDISYIKTIDYGNTVKPTIT